MKLSQITGIINILSEGAVMDRVETDTGLALMADGRNKMLQRNWTPLLDDAPIGAYERAAEVYYQHAGSDKRRDNKQLGPGVTEHFVGDARALAFYCSDARKRFVGASPDEMAEAYGEVQGGAAMVLVALMRLSERIPHEKSRGRQSMNWEQSAANADNMEYLKSAMKSNENFLRRNSPATQLNTDDAPVRDVAPTNDAPPASGGLAALARR